MNSVSLLEHYQLTLETFIADAEKKGYGTAKPCEQRLLHLAKTEQFKLANGALSAHCRKNRERMLMRAVEARCRVPQRLLKLTIVEERGRWLTTLQSYDLKLYEAMHEDRRAQKAEMA